MARSFNIVSGALKDYRLRAWGIPGDAGWRRGRGEEVEEKGSSSSSNNHHLEDSFLERQSCNGSAEAGEAIELPRVRALLAGCRCCSELHLASPLVSTGSTSALLAGQEVLRMGLLPVVHASSTSSSSSSWWALLASNTAGRQGSGAAAAAAAAAPPGAAAAGVAAAAAAETPAAPGALAQPCLASALPYGRRLIGQADASICAILRQAAWVEGRKTLLNGACAGGVLLQQSRWHGCKASAEVETAMTPHAALRDGRGRGGTAHPPVQLPAVSCQLPAARKARPCNWLEGTPGSAVAAMLIIVKEFP
eukprot:jgi/Mesen1/4022/ME000212S03053